MFYISIRYVSSLVWIELNGWTMTSFVVGVVKYESVNSKVLYLRDENRKFLNEIELT